MIIQIIENVGLLVFAVLALFPFAGQLDGVRGPSVRGTVLAGLVLGFTGFLVSNVPISFPDGTLVDTRAAPMIFAGFLAGFMGGAIAVCVGALTYALQGGSLSEAGMLGDLAHALAGAGFAYWLRRGGGAPKVDLMAATGLISLSWIAFVGARVVASSAAIGQVRTVEITAEALLASAAAVAVMATVTRFMFGALKDRLQVAETTERLELASRSAGLGIWDYDVTTGTTSWNWEQYKLYGIDPATFDINIETYPELIHQDDRKRVMRLVSSAIESGDTYDTEFRIVTPAGEIKHIKANGTVFRDHDGTALRMVGFNFDLTPIRASERQIRAAEQRLSDVARSIPGALYQHSFYPDGREELEYLNPQCEELLGLHADIVRKDPQTLLPLVHAEDRPKTTATLQTALRTLTPALVEFRLTAPSGEEKWLQGRGQPTRRDDGTIELSALLVDITEQVHLKEQLAQSQQLFFEAQKFDAVGKLTAGVAHDFNNLLAVILGNLELLQAGASEQDQELCGDSIEACRQGATLTQQLLTFSGKVALKPEVLDLNAVLARVERLLRRTLPESIRIELQRGPDLWPVEVDPVLLENAILNLALNARDAMRGGGSLVIRTANCPPKVAVGDEPGQTLPEGRCVMISVSDDGDGMCEETACRAFEPFFTTKPAGEGSGMGLAMVHGFVRQSKGAIRLVSGDGVGTTVRLIFPASGNPVQPVGPVEDPTPVATSKLRVLLVEDGDKVRAVVRRLLEELGHDVRECATGAEGLRAFVGDEEFDVLITDLVMPGDLQGPDLAAEVRDMRPDLGIIVMSGYPEAASSHGAPADISDVVLTKPVSMKELSRALNEVSSKKSRALQTAEVL